MPDFSTDIPFAARHIGPSADDQQAMLATLGYDSLGELMAAALPGATAPEGLKNLPAPLTER